MAPRKKTKTRQLGKQPPCYRFFLNPYKIEHLLAAIFTEQMPEIVGNKYLVVGTLEKSVWKRGTLQPLTLEEMLEALHDFKDVVTFKLM